MQIQPCDPLSKMAVTLLKAHPCVLLSCALQVTLLLLQLMAVASSVLLRGNCRVERPGQEAQWTSAKNRFQVGQVIHILATPSSSDILLFVSSSINNFAVKTSPYVLSHWFPGICRLNMHLMDGISLHDTTHLATSILCLFALASCMHCLDEALCKPFVEAL